MKNITENDTLVLFLTIRNQLLGFKGLATSPEEMAIRTIKNMYGMIDKVKAMESYEKGWKEYEDRERKKNESK